jgi:hypothetical protein
VPRFQEELREHMRSQKSIYESIRESGDLQDEDALRSEIERFKNTFNVQEEESLVGAAT